jgi:hypothetical protein
MKISTKKTSAFSLLAVLGLLTASLAYSGEFQRTTLQTEQMRCSSFLRVIDAELRKVPGILGMTAKFTDGLIFVDHLSRISAQKIATTITNLGNPATIVSETAIEKNEVSPFQQAAFGTEAGCCNPGGASPVAESWMELRRRFFRQRR